ncbi:TPA: hypothetical protein ACJXY4_005636 [Pseudomonas aeruginosa]
MQLDQAAESQIAKMARVLNVANTWADHFQIEAHKRSEFIDHYVTRNAEHRFWCVTHGSHTICRLGTVVLLFDGHRITEQPVSYTIQYSDRKPLSTQKGVSAPNHAPSPSEFNNLKRAIKRRKCLETNKLGLLTTFSKNYRRIATTEILMDVRKIYLSLEKSQDNRYVNPRTNWYMCLGAHTLKKFCSQLPAEPLKAVRSIHCPSIDLFNWILSGNITRRTQAIRAYPLLLPCIMLANLPEDRHDEVELINYFEEIKQVRNDIGNLVDAGLSIRPFLAQFYRCSENTIKSIGKYKIHHTGSILTLINQNRQGTCHTILNGIITATALGNKQPKCKKSWSNWLNFFGSYSGFYNRCGQSIGWPSFLAGMPELDSDLWPGLLKGLHDLRDLSINDYRDGFWDEAIGDWRYGNHWPALNLKSMLSISQKWHEHRAEKLKEFTDEAIQQKQAKQIWTWRPMLSAPIVHEATQVSIVELDRPELLVKEAIELDHCVDGYSNVCFDGHSRIISFQHAGKSLATAEFQLSAWKGKPRMSNLYCAQLRGMDNDDIPADSPAGQAYTWLCKQIAERAIEVYLEWPCVPIERRPGSENGVQERLSSYMKLWLRKELGI